MVLLLEYNIFLLFPPLHLGLFENYMVCVLEQGWK